MNVRVKVYGRVQGVFFRHTAKQKAESLGLVGWVRNNPGGVVETIAQGPEKKLLDFVSWCKMGPPLAQVERIEIDWSVGEDLFDRFDIL